MRKPDFGTTVLKIQEDPGSNRLPAMFGEDVMTFGE